MVSIADTKLSSAEMYMTQAEDRSQEAIRRAEAAKLALEHTNACFQIEDLTALQRGRITNLFDRLGALPPGIRPAPANKTTTRAPAAKKRVLG